ncbi:MAG TPA: hypothetical protein VN428_12150 [Bryobacteraceae bacterium]|nr:hypothetical protein [Bryobacteraceae bacterium]
MRSLFRLLFIAGLLLLGSGAVRAFSLQMRQGAGDALIPPVAVAGTPGACQRCGCLTCSLEQPGGRQPRIQYRG